jgi:hypothetical protein
MHTKLQVENLKGRDQLGALGIDGRIILKWVFKDVGYEGVNWIHMTPNGASCSLCEHSNEPSGFTKGVEFLT